MITTNQSNGLDILSVAPSNGQKYSPNLYKWLTSRNRKHRAWTSRVYRDSEGVFWIGELESGELIGSKLYGVLCNGSQEKSACWVNLRGLVEVEDFWPRYMRDGRCAIDTDHKRSFVGDETRWMQNGDTRSCLWCAKADQVLSRWTESVERSEWRNLELTKQ